MASGIVKLSGGGALYGQLSWSSEADISSNSSEVTVTLQFGKSRSYEGTTGTFSGWLKIGDSEANGSKYGKIEGYWHDMFSHTVTVQHNDDGKGSVKIAGSVTGPGGTSLAGKTASGEEVITLDTIPRSASLDGAEDFTDEGKPTIRYKNDAGYGASSLTACIASQDGETVYVPYRAIPKTGTEYTFDLTEAERNALRSAIPNQKSMTVKFCLKCTIGATEYFSDLEKTFKIVNADPIFNPSITEENQDTAALTGDSGKLIRYVSNAKVASGAAAIKGASLALQEIKNGSLVIQAGAGTFTAVESGEFVFSAEDSRGNTSSTIIKRDIAEYIKLTCNVGSNAPDTDGNFLFQLSGNYFNASFGAADNTLGVEYRYKIADGAFTDWIVMEPTVTGNTYRAAAEFTGLDYQTIYTFQARATDRIGTVTTLELPMQSTPVFDWGKDDFRINGRFRVRKEAQFDGPAQFLGDLDVGGVLSVNGRPINPFEIGAVYISARDKSPAEIYGGDWTRITGAFLLAASSQYPAGSSGGESTVTLEVKHMPPHNHWGSARFDYDTPYGTHPTAVASDTKNGLIETDSEGGGKAHNNMPPYKAYYMWERVG